MEREAEMEFKDVLYKRQSIRRFTDQEVKAEDLEQILDAARVAPSGDNRQNWHFVVVRSPELKEKIRQAIEDRNEEIAALVEPKDPERAARFRKFARHFAYFIIDAPVLIVTFTNIDQPSGAREYQIAGIAQAETDKLYLRSPGLQSIGAAVENMTLRAVDLGYGSCWLTGSNYAAEQIAAVLKEAGFEKEGYFIANMLALGVPQPDPKSPPKKTLEEIVTYL
jgi:nitroreductase